MGAQLIATLAKEEQKLLACVHCGLCLEACPTYVATGDENDSPRGRIYLMRAVEEGRLAANSPSFERHIDRCLGCRACEPVCPAGVEYGQLLEAARATLFESGSLPVSAEREKTAARPFPAGAERSGRELSYKLLRFALRHVWLHAGRLQFAFMGARTARNLRLVRLLLKSRLPGLISRRFEFALALLESSRGSKEQAGGLASSATPRAGSPVESAPRKDHPAYLFTGCVTSGLFDRVNQATARVLKVNGYEVQAPMRQVCCGALHAHAGDLEGARELARQNIAAFGAGLSGPIITNAGGCGAMLVSYGHLLAADEQLAESAHAFCKRVRDVSQQLEATPLKSGASIGSNKITYDASCHLINGQHAGDAPLKLLRTVPDLSLVPLEGSDRCCGGAGVYNLLEPGLSAQVLDEKLKHIKETGASVLATGNPGCHMQIGAGAMLSHLPLRVCHPVELLDESYYRAGFYLE